MVEGVVVLLPSLASVDAAWEQPAARTAAAKAIVKAPVCRLSRIIVSI